MKVLKSRIFIFVLGFTLATTIGVVAANLSASNISFEPDDENWNVETVQAALNDLYTEKQSTRLIKLSETTVRSNAAHTYNVSNIDGYQNFTASNFIFGFQEFGWVGGSTTEGTGTVSYNSSTGIVTFPKVIGGGTNATLDISYYPILVY